jgi:hypothetical protein
MRYIPALVGRFAPQVGLPSPSHTGEPVDQVPTLLATTGFELSPGALDLWLGPAEASTGRPVARWTYPDGSGGSACGIFSSAATPEIIWARFGYAVTKGQTTASLHDVLSGPGGDLLRALPDMPPSVTSLGSGREEQGEPGPMALPSGLLAMHQGMAYEFRLASGAKPSDLTTKGFAKYRLIAVRTASGEVMTFTYGPNGVDFEAAWEGEKVRVALDGMAATSPVPALDAPLSALDPAAPVMAFRDVEARLRVTYEGGKAIPGYTVIALMRPESLTAEGGRISVASGNAQADPVPFRDAMQVACVQEDGSGESITFGYGKAQAVSFAGPYGTQSFAPTVLQEIAGSGRTLRLEWEGQSCPRQTEIGGGVAPWAAWSFGVAELHDRDLDGAAGTYRRSVPRLGNGVRQSRHFALECNPQSATSCKTYVRDRWEFGATGTSGTEAATQEPQRRLPYDYEGDIPTFMLDPQALTLVPVPGQLTRWLN